MAAITAPGVCRYAVNGSYQNRPVVNIVDLVLSDLGIGIDREEACFNSAGDILNQWSDHILPNLCDNYLALSVSWVDLDSLDGSTGERSSTADNTWSAGGEVTSPAMPGNVAFRINKAVTSARGLRGGRMYLCGVPESATEDGAPNSVNAGTIAALNSALEAFRSGLEGPEVIGAGPDQYTSSPNVVHTIGGVYAGRSRITAYTTDGTLGSQRRRLRG